MTVATTIEMSRPRGTALPAVFAGGELLDFASARSGGRELIRQTAAWQPVPRLRA